MSSMDGHPEQPSWWTPEEAAADASALEARESEFEEPIPPEELATNEAIRRALASEAFIDRTTRRGGTILRRNVDGSIEEQSHDIEPTPPTETDEDNQGEQ